MSLLMLLKYRVDSNPEKEYFVTSLAIKAFVEKPNKEILLLIAQDPNGNYFWDLPGGGVRRGTKVAESAIEKIKQEIPNLDIRDPKPKLFTHNGEVEETTLGREINGHDILFVGTNIKVDKNFAPEISEHLGTLWIDKKRFDLLTEGDGTLNSPTLNPWLKNLTDTHFRENGLPFYYQ